MEIRQSNISQLVDSAVDGRINLPLFQRAFGWKRDRVFYLFDSLLKGYPIGVLLLWDNEAYSYARANSRHRRCDWLVDGQQRITALCLLYNKRPIWYDGKRAWSDLVKENQVFVNVRTDEVRLLHSKPQEDPFAYISVSSLLPLSEKEVRGFADSLAAETLTHDVTNKVADELDTELNKTSVEYSEDEDNDSLESVEYESDEVFDEGSKSFFYDPYTDLHDLSRKIESRIHRVLRIGSIPVPQMVTKHPPRDIAKIFTRLNSQGLQVQSTDIFLALLASALPKWVKEEFRPFCIEMEKSGLSINPSIYIKALTGYVLKNADIGSIIGEDGKKTLTQREITDNWETVKKSIVSVIRGIRGYGIFSERIIPSKNTLVPLFVMRSVFGNKFRNDAALNWFMAANYGRYKQGSNYYLNKDLNIIHEANRFNDAKEALLNQLSFDWKFQSYEFAGRQYSKKAYQLVLYLTLYNRECKDWFTGDRIAFAGSSGDWVKGFKPEWHHIFPKARIRSQKGQLVKNSYANFTALNEKTNRAIRDSLPIHYFNGEIKGSKRISRKQLKLHMIPLEEELWKLSKFPDFVRVRSNLLTNGIHRFIKQLG